MLAGVWVLALIPFMAVMDRTGWGAKIPVPNLFQMQGSRSLDDSYCQTVYAYLMFCIGVVLLFSKERNRQPGPLDRTRRWGIVASYGVLFLGMIQFAFITSLVLLGIAAMFQSLPHGYEPAITGLLRNIGTFYIYYGPHSSRIADVSLECVSPIAILLACVPLFNALRSSGPRIAAAIVLFPLVLAAVVQILYACMYSTSSNMSDLLFTWNRAFYFSPHSLVNGIGDLNWTSFPPREIVLEISKSLACGAIAVWLTIAQLAAVALRSRNEKGENEIL